MKNTFDQKAIVVITICLFVILNFLSSAVSLRLDLSKGHAYTLSQSTEKIVHSLKKPVSITFFVSSNLPSRLQPVKQDVTDFLKEYKRIGGSRVSYVIKDPKNDQAAQKDAADYGIMPIQFSQQESDQYALSNAFFGIGISYDGKKASLEQITGVDDLEYNISSAIYKLTTKELPTVGVMGGDELFSKLSILQEAAKSQFQFQPSSTPEAAMKTIVVFGTNTKTYADEEIAQLKRYLNQGGSVLFFVDGVAVSDSLTSDKSTHNLFTLLKQLGVTLNQDLVLSRSAELVNFGQGQGLFQVVLPYPYWVKTNDVDKSSLFANVQSLTFPWPSSIKTSSQDVRIVAKSSSQSWNQTSAFTLNPQQIQNPSAKQFTRFALVAEGRTKNGGQFLVIPSSRFVQDQYLGRTNDNLGFVLNVLSEYAAGGALSGIRSRSVDLYLLPNFDNAQKNIFKYTNIALLPGLFVLYGVYRLYKRSRPKNS